MSRNHQSDSKQNVVNEKAVSAESFEVERDAGESWAGILAGIVIGLGIALIMAGILFF